jgi:hypothetical protein
MSPKATISEETATSHKTAAAPDLPTHGPRRIVPVADFTARGLAAPVGGAPLPHLINHGGPVLGDVQVVPIYWGLVWATLATKTNVTLAQELNHFFDFILTSPYMDLLAEYSTSTTKIHHGSRLPSHTITNSQPGTATPTGRQVTDAQIQTALRGWIDSKVVPATTANTLYFIFLPPNVVSLSFGQQSCGSPVGFCGYHSNVGNAFYAVIPFASCGGCEFAGDFLDTLTEVSSHELAEAVTDPEGTTWFDPNPAPGEEIGDICNRQTVRMGGFLVQTEWSNAQGVCAFQPANLFPNWLQLDNNPASAAIVVEGDNLYQLHKTGNIFKFTGPPITGWQHLDNNPATKQIAAAGNHLYQLHDTGRIFKYTGVPLTGWQLLDQNSATAFIVAAGNDLYQLHNTGKIWKYTGTPLTGWQLLDQNPATIKIAADGGNLYQLHNTGKLWKYTGTPLTGWQELDQNPATKQLTAAGGNLYQVHDTGKIWRYTGVPLTGWQLLDQNPATKLIAAAGNDLYQLHNTGKIWKYTGTPLSGWQELDGNAASVGISAGNHLYQLHNTGRIWEFTG